MMPETRHETSTSSKRALIRTGGKVDEHGRPLMLDPWAIDMIGWLAKGLGVEVTITEGPDGNPSKPDVQVEFSPQVFDAEVLQADTSNMNSR